MKLIRGKTVIEGPLASYTADEGSLILTMMEGMEVEIRQVTPQVTQILRNMTIGAIKNAIINLDTGEIAIDQTGA